MKRRVEEVLDNLIKCYLTTHQPISSTKLKEISNLTISPSSIRGYFQILKKDGFVKKEHFSSGAYPTKKAMEFFWQKNLKPFKIDLASLEKRCLDLDIAGVVKLFENQMLVNVYNVSNKFILLEFENKEIVLEYDDNLYRFFKSLRYHSLKEILKIVDNLSLEVKKSLNFSKTYFLNKKRLYSIIEEDKLSNFKEGLNINGDVVIYKFKYNDYDIAIIGDIYANFLALKGGDNEQKA